MADTRTIHFCIPVESLAALDRLAAIHDRDLNYVLKEAVAQYLDLNSYYTGLIREGLRQAEAGEEGIPHEQVMAEIREMIEKEKRGPG